MANIRKISTDMLPYEQIGAHICYAPNTDECYGGGYGHSVQTNVSEKVRKRIRNFRITRNNTQVDLVSRNARTKELLKNIGKKRRIKNIANKRKKYEK